MPASPDDPDPQGLIAAYLRAAPGKDGEAEGIWLAWVLSLDQALDPAVAATTLLEGLSPGELPQPQRRLLELLDTTRRWPAPAMAAFTGARRQGSGRRRDR